MVNPIDYYGDITLHGGALKSVALETVTELPATPVEKQIVVFNNTVQIYIGGKWTVLGSIDNIKTVQDALDKLTNRVKAVEDGKVDKIEGKGLSTEDYTTAEKTKLAGIAEGAQVNVIESVEVDGVAQAIAEKKVTLDLSAYAKKTDLASVLEWKGVVATVSALPTKGSGAKKGDVYHVTEKSAEYAFDGENWQELGSEIDLTVFYTKTEIDDKVDDLNTAIGKKVDALTTKPTAGTYPKVKINAEGQVTEGIAQITINDISDIANANVATAGKLASPVGISITGGATAEAVQFDGSGAIALNVTAINGSVVSEIPVGSVPPITTEKISDFATQVKATVNPQFKTVALSEASKDGNKYTITTTSGKMPFGVMVLHNGVQVFVSTTVALGSIILDFNSAITASEFKVTYIEQF